VDATQFWDNIFAQGEHSTYSRVEMPDRANPILRRALRHFGDVRGRKLIDVGCGRGASSLYFASFGADVISVDLSGNAVRNLSEYCLKHNVSNVRPMQLSALELRSLGPVDFVFGSMILHHIEPFTRFAAELRAVLPEGGKAFFWENNARSRLMIWFRQHVVGKLWVPKHGDAEEFPLTLAEVDELRGRFAVDVEYPDLVLFRMISRYLLRGHCMQPFEALDRFGYRFEALRKYSYQQYLCLS
jgi:cyclopropane fatty-acyl-phospholipid synthase-like methyltransferase